MGGMCLESQLAEDQGLTFKMNKGLAEEFQIYHSLDFAKTNPMYGMVPNAAPTQPSQYTFGGTLIGGVEKRADRPPEPSWIAMYELSPTIKGSHIKNSTFGVNFIRMFSNNRKLNWAFGGQKNEFNMIRECTYTSAGEKLTWSATLAQPTLLDRSGPTFQGVALASFLTKINPKWLFGAEVTYRKQSQMGQTMSDLAPSLALSYTHDDDNVLSPNGKKFSDGSDTITAKATTNAYLQFNASAGIMPQGLMLEHNAKGGVTDCPGEMFAQLKIAKDPMPAMMGGTGGMQVTGCVGLSQHIKDPSVNNKPQPGMPPVMAGSTVKAKLTTEGDAIGIVESSLHPLPGQIGIKATYNMFKDTLKMGAGITFG